METLNISETTHFRKKCFRLCCKVEKGLFTDLIILTLHGLRQPDLSPLRDILYFMLKSIMINLKISENS